MRFKLGNPELLAPRPETTHREGKEAPSSSGMEQRDVSGGVSFFMRVGQKAPSDAARFPLRSVSFILRRAESTPPGEKLV
jgi:hypothetical protein